VTRFELRDVLGCTGARLVRGSDEGHVVGVSTDTRTIAQRELYVALSGPNFDGNAFAVRAAEAAAGAVLLRGPLRDDEPPLDALPDDLTVLVHDDPRRALGDLAAWHRSRLVVPVLGITGSCGKTTTKNILVDLLADRLGLVASPASFNNDIGVPHTLLLADDETDLLVVEMGTNSPGEIAGLCRIARPTAGIITNLGAAHLEGLGTVEGVAREKGDLAASLPRDGFLVLDGDGRFAPELRSRTSARVLTFTVEGAPGERGDLDATELFFHSGGTTFRLNGEEVTSPLLGTHNVQNLLAAFCACEGLGIPFQEVLHRVPELRGGRQRMERIELGDLTVFDDSWNSNPESCRAAVRVLAGLHGFERRVLVLGDMLELGDLAAELHHRLGRDAARAGIDRLILVGELAGCAAAGALEGGLTPDAVTHFDDTEGACAAVPELVARGDAVLVKGSRRMHLEDVVTTLVENNEERGG
jgi:UDP-N-acetylmuramoyl-tripeptide--D-alanyl-D-alanine ligase